MPLDGDHGVLGVHAAALASEVFEIAIVFAILLRQNMAQNFAR